MGADGGVRLYNYHKILDKYGEEKLHTFMRYMFAAKPTIVSIPIKNLLPKSPKEFKSVEGTFLSLSYGTNILLDLETEDFHHVMEESYNCPESIAKEIVEFLLWIIKNTFLTSWETWT